MFYLSLSTWGLREPATLPVMSDGVGRMILPYMPEDFSVLGGTQVTEVRNANYRTNVTRNGNKPQTVSFDSYFPRYANMTGLPADWILSPEEYTSWCRVMMEECKAVDLALWEYRTDNAVDVVLWSMPATLRSFSIKDQGGVPDALGYSMSFTEHWELPIYTPQYLLKYVDYLEGTTSSAPITLMASSVTPVVTNVPDPSPAPSADPAPPSTPPSAANPSPASGTSPIPPQYFGGDVQGQSFMVGKPRVWPVLAGTKVAMLPVSGPLPFQRPTVLDCLQAHYKTVPVATIRLYLQKICDYNGVNVAGYNPPTNVRAPALYVPSAINAKLVAAAK